MHASVSAATATTASSKLLSNRDSIVCFKKVKKYTHTGTGRGDARTISGTDLSIFRSFNFFNKEIKILCLMLCCCDE